MCCAVCVAVVCAAGTLNCRQIIVEDKSANYDLLRNATNPQDADPVAFNDRQTVLLEAQRALVTIRDRFQLPCVTLFCDWRLIFFLMCTTAQMT